MKHLSQPGVQRHLPYRDGLLMQVALLPWCPEIPLLLKDKDSQHFRFHKTFKQPVLSWHCTLWMLCPIPHVTHCNVIFPVMLLAFITIFFSSIHLMLPHWHPPAPTQPLLDKCVYGFPHVYKSSHNPLSKINQGGAEGSGGE